MICPDRAALTQARRTTLPKVLHQAWLAPTGAPRQPAGVLRVQAHRWPHSLRHWQWALWTSEASRELWSTHAPELLNVYLSYNKSVERADATRLLIMSVYGGVYADLDVVPCDDFERSLSDAMGGAGRCSTNEQCSVPLLLVRDPWRGKPARQAVQHVSNFFFASVPDHPFWGFALRLLAERRSHPWGTMYKTGPYFVDHAWKSFRRLNGGCPAQLLEKSAAVLTHNDWQEQRFGGLLDWLGVDRAKDCAEGSLQAVFADLPLQKRLLTRRSKKWALYVNESLPKRDLLSLHPRPLIVC
ncbi:hypothetical protein EMIHUDRAFT_197740 [Emiliania huxleyi CCMP1516]|uniref:Alpha 1,4-glycosyltransferase domain-containing protein n=2 Tax=Emiliania huxleyi TaxID=2903 RepID=A0A0D3IDN2_EMIH1|nr:hypothetical protein EMIHUDRAFT_197740 [Emiliania huxleyi CCMP1516]EOD09367.1 hypothetical protein EMIHUDRAFT_197740 [Emiliania huxleyi CCMP1516]|eukprot:XP_005761796.1 hypothetical protein EMIHUDRAFT_197740 [Emiliania huxleyi CCMP1516]